MARAVFKTVVGGDEPPRWVRLPCALAMSQPGHCISVHNRFGPDAVPGMVLATPTDGAALGAEWMCGRVERLATLRGRQRQAERAEDGSERPERQAGGYAFWAWLAAAAVALSLASSTLVVNVTGS